MSEPGKKKILICDDEPMIVESIRYVVKKEGFEFVVAHDGQEAVEKLADFHPDLIVLDASMPRMTGYEVCSVIKGDDRTAGIPVLMLTANAQATDRDKAVGAGADEYMTKPFSPRNLREKILAMTGIQ
ncbi:MAG: hypothetical protein BMS9Abin36_1019 [Gammaproteobacteria bacterium]|nr:MAG: hypothetical protein BMS9Abin36_1019 [Gammaproteobacteria bacterium]